MNKESTLETINSVLLNLFKNNYLLSIEKGTPKIHKKFYQALLFLRRHLCDLSSITHKFIEEWSQMLYGDSISLRDRPITSDEFYTRYEEHFQQKHNAIHTSMFCKALQVHMTQSDVVHGATPQCNSDERMVVFF